MNTLPYDIYLYQMGSEESRGMSIGDHHTPQQEEASSSQPSSEKYVPLAPGLQSWST